MTDLDFAMTHRRKLHQIPETSMEEVQTTEYIVSFLDELDISYERPLDTGVVAYLDGNSDRTIAFRADIDALPIHEENNIEFRSSTDNKMHACGHDGHTTALMLFAKRCLSLSERNQLGHNVVLIFQPSEETAAGANQLLNAWAPKQEIEAVFGVHLMPDEDEGRVLLRDGPITASATEYRFYINGESSHVASKHQGISAIEVLMHLTAQVAQLQHFHLDGLNRNIIHIGNLNAGEAINTVASRGYLEGTIRTYVPEDLTEIKSRLGLLAETAKTLFGADVQVTFNEGYPPVINDEVLRNTVDDALNQLQLDVIDKDKPYLFGEDFSFYQKLAPSYFVFFGSRNAQKGYTSSLHTSTFNFDESVLVSVADYYEAILNSL
ncbi:M20 metallopeptidase family protein [Salinicoccus halodurans]|uniref:Hydrolase n=1 Tax=Salinicoccus halodurans TaxID=407035 RepID=A0A0F7HLH5_9STAP|nr:amidohydrolase [Salinicoccus halodurans]AKG74137.1 hydrolase [Salinicoccus halodurans]SFK61000.1 amidohydrolase [Salinicoccus halodurans]